MKKVFQIFLLAMLVLTSCQQGNTLTMIIDKEPYEEMLACAKENGIPIESFMEEYLPVGCYDLDGAPIPKEIVVNKKGLF